jgi:hypothetical protein
VGGPTTVTDTWRRELRKRDGTISSGAAVLFRFEPGVVPRTGNYSDAGVWVQHLVLT